MKKTFHALSVVATAAVLGGSIMAASAPDQIPAAAFEDPVPPSMELDVPIAPIAEFTTPAPADAPPCPGILVLGADGLCYSPLPEAPVAAPEPVAVTPAPAPAPSPATCPGNFIMGTDGFCAEPVTVEPEPVELAALPVVEAPAGPVPQLDPHEDTAPFDCRIHGNQWCGVSIEGQTYVIQFSGGVPVAVAEGYAPL